MPKDHHARIASKPRFTSLRRAGLISLGLFSQPVFALVLNNQELTITGTTPLDYYVLNNQAHLIVDGARTQDILVRQGSLLEMLSGTTQANGVAIHAVDSQVRLNNANVTSDTTFALVLGHSSAGSGSTATVNNSTLQGGSVAVQVNADGRLDMADSQVTASNAAGTAIGLRLLSGTAVVTRSQINGQDAGVQLSTELARSYAPQLVLDGTRVSSAGVGIDVATQGNARIVMRNGTAISSGNGTALRVGDTANASVTALDSSLAGDVQVLGKGVATLGLHRSTLAGNVLVQDQGTLSLAMTDGSRMTGDLVVAPGAQAQLNMVNGSQLEGRLDNVGQAIIASNANWTMTGNSNVSDLTLNGGQVSFAGNNAFHDLTVHNLSGNGTFVMAGDFVDGSSDKLIVTGTSQGQHGLLVGSTGQEASVERMPLVQTADGGAQFHLLNARERVDVGAFSYELAQEGNDWVLNRETRTVAPITLSAIALFNTPITVAYGEMSSLRTRMGELRYSEGRSAGVWARAYGNKFNVSGLSNYQQNQNGVSVGADMQVAETDWLVGVLAGSSHSDLNLDYGSSGSVDSYYFGGYATWLDPETGYYVDTVLKYNRYDSVAKAAMSDGTRSKGDYDSHGLSGSVEVGKHIKLDQGYFIEPFAQVNAAIVTPKDYTFDNGLRAESDHAKSLLGKVGTTVGKTIALDGGGMIQPYVKAALAHEFAQRSEVQVNDNVFRNDLSGSRAELGAGVSLALSKQFRVHADVEYSHGEHIEQPYGVNVGVRYDF